MGIRDLGLLTLRGVAGATLAAHGLPKLRGGPGTAPPPWLARAMGSNYPPSWEASGPANFAKVLERLGVPMPTAAAYVSGAVELGGGLALATGFLSPWANLAVAANMAVAARTAHGTTGFYGQGGYEFPALLGTVALGLALTGPGAVSLDRLLGRRRG